MDLYTESHSDLDLTVARNVLTYTYTGQAPRSVFCRVEVGSLTSLIQGNGPYLVYVELNDVRVSPDSLVTVPDVEFTMLQSREVLIKTGDKLEVFVTGLAGDVAVDTVASLVDVTPLTEQDVYGAGEIAIDHNYGGPDALRVLTTEGASLADANLVVYLKSEYDAGNRSASFVRGRATTAADGRWVGPIMLNPGTYTLVVSKQGVISPLVHTLVVVA